MADSLLTVLDTLYAKIESFKAEVARIEERCERLEEENRELQRRVEEAESARERAMLDVEFLAVSHRLADNPDKLVDTRRLIAGLIRNIDRCIEMLKE